MFFVPFPFQILMKREFNKEIDDMPTNEFFSNVTNYVYIGHVVIFKVF